MCDNFVVARSRFVVARFTSSSLNRTARCPYRASEVKLNIVYEDDERVKSVNNNQITEVTHGLGNAIGSVKRLDLKSNLIHDNRLQARALAIKLASTSHYCPTRSLLATLPLFLIRETVPLPLQILHGL